MISRKYFNTFPALNLPSYITNVPWPNLVLDNFIEEDALDLIVYQVLSKNYEYDIDYRGKGRIEFSLLHSEALWKTIYSAEMISILSEAFGYNLKFNKTNLLQMRRMSGDTPSFPLHNDYIEGLDTIVVFLYLSSNWKIEYGGRLFLHDSIFNSEIIKTINPISNRLVAFRTMPEYWHSVEKVVDWERLSVLSVWDII